MKWQDYLYITSILWTQTSVGHFPIIYRQDFVKRKLYETKAKKIQIGRDLGFRRSPWSEYCFLVLVFLHGVRGEFTDDVSETAVGPISTGHDQWRWLWNLRSLELLSQVLDLLKAHTVQHSVGKCVQTLMCLRNFKLHNF
jgi:hypothetical protein